MGNQQSKWKGRLLNPFRPSMYVRLPSTSSGQPVLEFDGYPETNYSLLANGSCTEAHRADIEAIRKRNLDLEKKVDELMQKVNELQSKPLKPEKDNEDDTQTIHERNSILETEINQLKAKIIALEAASAKALHKEIGPGEKKAVKKIDAKQSKPQPKAFEPVTVSDSKESKLHTKSLEELAAAFTVLIFLICVLIGMHI